MPRIHNVGGVRPQLIYTVSRFECSNHWEQALKMFSTFSLFNFFLKDHSVGHCPQSSSGTSQDKTELQVTRQPSTRKSTMAESKSTKLQKNHKMLKDKKRTRRQYYKQVSVTSQCQCSPPGYLSIKGQVADNLYPL